MLHFLISQFESLWPERYRREFEVSPASAMTSGILQFLICLGLFIYRYLALASNEVFGGTTTALKAMEVAGDSAVAGSGIFVLMQYVIQPLTLVLVYFALEGLIRFTAAFVTGEIVPTVPLAVVAWLHGRVDEARAERALGERVPDAVEAVDSPDIQLRIRSCRPKESWDHLMTIFYQDEMYEVAEEERGNLPRRFVYLLRRKPNHKVVRGTYHYDPKMKY
jgi:hypothetical protein